jgi:hypothetical protein
MAIIDATSKPAQGQDDLDRFNRIRLLTLANAE